MNTEKFLKAYNESRNGCNHFIRHPLVRNFHYSDGVEECAEAGCYWLLDILATELPPVFRKNAAVSNMCSVRLNVEARKAAITGEFEDDVIAWRREIDFTDMPSGEWTFLITQEDCLKMILLTER